MKFIGYHTIYGVEGEHATPYMTRVWIGRLRLHIFHRGDADPNPHDHPWDFWTFPLTAYVEEVVEQRPVSERYVSRLQIVPAFRLSFRPAEHTHRVIGRWNGDVFWDWPGRAQGDGTRPRAVPGKIVTIVWQGRQRRRWGFLKNRDGKWCWTPWRDYSSGGRHAPCEPVERDR